jgi:hypothetical protein
VAAERQAIEDVLGVGGHEAEVARLEQAAVDEGQGASSYCALGAG